MPSKMSVMETVISYDTSWIWWHCYKNNHTFLCRLNASPSFTAAAHRVLHETGTYLWDGAPAKNKHAAQKRSTSFFFCKVPQTSACPRKADGKKILVRVDAALLKDIRCMGSQAVSLMWWPRGRQEHMVTWPHGRLVTQQVCLRSHQGFGAASSHPADLCLLSSSEPSEGPCHLRKTKSEIYTLFVMISEKLIFFFIINVDFIADIIMKMLFSVTTHLNAICATLGWAVYTTGK